MCICQYWTRQVVELADFTKVSDRFNSVENALRAGMSPDLEIELKIEIQIEKVSETRKLNTGIM